MKYVLDAHCHTIASGHAYSTIMEYAAEAAKQGLSLIGITDHAPKMPGAAGAMYFRNGSAVPKALCGVKTLFGAEVNILDYAGGVDLGEDILKRLDFVIASYHALCVSPSTEKDHTEGFIAVMNNPHISIIGHPGDPNFLADWELVAKTAAQTGTAVEINNASLIPGAWTRAGSGAHIRELLRHCKRYGPYVIVGSDAHFHTEAGRHEHAYALLREAEYPSELVLNTSVDLFKRFLNQ